MSWEGAAQRKVHEQEKQSRGLGCQRGERNPASPSFSPPLRQTELMKSYYVFELAPKHY